MERGPRHKEVGKLPRLKRRTQPDNLDEQVQALRRFQSLPGFVDGIRAARRRDRGGVLVRLVVPLLGLRVMAMQRRAKLESQLVDAVMILSSSLKGGLSLVQSIEVLVEEMGAPISQEFGVILRENKMGITLEESLTRLHERLKIEELTYLVGSLLVARETGGDLTKVLSRLATTIRDNRRLKDSIKTLTLQGKLQGIIMSALPFFFVAWVLSFNKGHFDIMFSTEIGRMLLIAALFLQIIGMFLIKIFSTIRI